MENIIENLNNDIDKCKESLYSKNLLEISISIEEMIDKYKGDKEDLIDLEKSNVWLYKKEDLESIINILENLKLNYINQYKANLMKEGFENFKSNLESNKNILDIKKVEVLSLVTQLENIINSSIESEYKWEKMKKHIEYISNQEFTIGYELLKLITLMF